MKPEEDKCDYPHCKRLAKFTWLGKRLCDESYAKIGNTVAEENAFRTKLGLPPMRTTDGKLAGEVTQPKEGEG